VALALGSATLYSFTGFSEQFVSYGITGCLTQLGFIVKITHVQTHCVAQPNEFCCGRAPSVHIVLMKLEYD